MKSSLALIVFLLFVCTAQAQFQVGVNVGFNLPTSGIALPGFVEVDRDGTQKVLVATLGAGINYNGTVGYQVHPNVVANLDFGYFQSFRGGFHVYLAPNTDSKIDASFVGKFTHVTPSVVFQTTEKEGKVQPYARFGLIFGAAKVEVTQTPSNVPNLTGKYEAEYSGGTSTGFLGGIGIKKRFSEHLTWMVELTTKTVTAYPKKLTNTRNFDGLPLDSKRFVDKITPSSPDSDDLTFPIPYSSFGLSLGLSYKL